MDDTSSIAIGIGIVVPVVIFLGVLFYLKCWRTRTGPGYSEVNHALDEEEIEFKRFIESQGSSGSLDFDELLGLDDTTHDLSHESIEEDTFAFAFDEEERNHLAILEKFRNSLVGSSGDDGGGGGCGGGSGSGGGSGGAHAPHPRSETDDYNPIHTHEDEDIEGGSSGDEPPDEIRT